MSYKAIVHMGGASEPVQGEIDELPVPTALFITLKHPTRLNGNDLEWVNHLTNVLLIPFAQILGVEIIEQRGQDLISRHNLPPHT